MRILPSRFSCVTKYAFAETQKVIVAMRTTVCWIPVCIIQLQNTIFPCQEKELEPEELTGTCSLAT